jgi:hypothetical protein
MKRERKKYSPKKGADEENVSVFRSPKFTGNHIITI